MAGLYRKRRQSGRKKPTQGPNFLKEADFLQQIRHLAKQFGWMEYHTYDSRRSTPGWPDLVLCRPPELLIIEVKTATGRLTSAQRQWITCLSWCGIETHVWRPSDMDYIFERLRPKSGTPPDKNAC